MLNEAVVRRTERWFVRQGMPQLIAEYRFRRYVLPRMLPFLSSTIVVSLTLAALVARIGPRAGAVVAITVLVVGLGTPPWLPGRLARPVSSLFRPSATAVCVAYAATPVLIPLLLIGAYCRPDRALVIGHPGAPTGSVWWSGPFWFWPPRSPPSSLWPWS